MARAVPLAEHLAPDSIRRLERAAEQRYNEAEQLLAKGHYLAAIYLLGYSVEMCLTAAYFRSAGFHANTAIGRDSRQRRMAQGRQLRGTDGEPVMNSDPHPLVGWARFLYWQRSASPDLPQHESRRLQEAVALAELVYRHWRPELRYKVKDVERSQIDEVKKAAAWFIEQRGRL